jgi:hypothetical protein
VRISRRGAQREAARVARPGRRRRTSWGCRGPGPRASRRRPSRPANGSRRPVPPTDAPGRRRRVSCGPIRSRSRPLRTVGAHDDVQVDEPAALELGDAHEGEDHLPPQRRRRRAGEAGELAEEVDRRTPPELRCQRVPDDVVLVAVALRAERLAEDGIVLPVTGEAAQRPHRCRLGWRVRGSRRLIPPPSRHAPRNCAVGVPGKGSIYLFRRGSRTRTTGMPRRRPIISFGSRVTGADPARTPTPGGPQDRPSPRLFGAAGSTLGLEERGGGSHGIAERPTAPVAGVLRQARHERRLELVLQVTLGFHSAARTRAPGHPATRRRRTPCRHRLGRASPEPPRSAGSPRCSATRAAEAKAARHFLEAAPSTSPPPRRSRSQTGISVVLRPRHARPRRAGAPPLESWRSRIRPRGREGVGG